MNDPVPEQDHLVVVNHEEQYSIWLASRAIPEGWRAVGDARSRADCLAYIDETWTDMRPLSLRKHMDAQQQQAQSADPSGPGAEHGSSDR